MRPAVAVVTAAALVACGTIVQGKRQDVSFMSTPVGATVTVDGNVVGQTPVTAKLKRKDKHSVRIDMAGYQPFQATIERKVSGWVWGNIIFGGLIGLAVDAGTGGMYRLKPDHVAATLTTAQIDDGSDRIFIAVVTHADPRWQRVGQLQRR
jgi:hypothetical protein